MPDRMSRISPRQRGRISSVTPGTPLRTTRTAPATASAAPAASRRVSRSPRSSGPSTTSVSGSTTMSRAALVADERAMPQCESAKAAAKPSAPIQKTRAPCPGVSPRGMGAVAPRRASGTSTAAQQRQRHGRHVIEDEARDDVGGGVDDVGGEQQGGGDAHPSRIRSAPRGRLTPERHAGARGVRHQPVLRVAHVALHEADGAAGGDHAPLGAQLARPHGLREIDLELERRERLALAEKGRVGHAHGGVGDVGQHAAVQRAHRVGVALGGLELDQRAAGLDGGEAEADERRDPWRRRLAARQLLDQVEHLRHEASRQPPPLTADSSVTPNSTNASAMTNDSALGPPPSQWIASEPPTAASTSRMNPATSGHTTRPAPCDAKYSASPRPKNP